MTRWCAGMLLAALAWGGVAAETPPSAPEEARHGLVDLEDRPRDLAEFRGSIVVVNFWATWCIPCRDEMPLLVAIAKRFRASGVVVVGASADTLQEARRVRRFVRDTGIDFPIWVGATTDDMAGLGLGGALPATAVLDRDGRVAVRVDGVIDGPGLEASIDWLLGERTGPAPPPPIGVLAEPGEAAGGHGHDDHGHEDHDHAHGRAPGVGLDGPSLVPS